MCESANGTLAGDRARAMDPVDSAGVGRDTRGAMVWAEVALDDGTDDAVLATGMLGAELWPRTRIAARPTTTSAARLRTDITTARIVFLPSDENSFRSAGSQKKVNRLLPGA